MVQAGQVSDLSVKALADKLYSTLEQSDSKFTKVQQTDGWMACLNKYSSYAVDGWSAGNAGWGTCRRSRRVFIQF